ncbi:MAG: hypothetical protein KBA31_08800 [Alphaproteobacteria bacterium]|nr:hypothetical protein [Alphaproteobacteria bacterium]
MKSFVLCWDEDADGVRQSRQKEAPTADDVLALMDSLSLNRISALTVDYGGIGQDADANLCISGEPGAYICYVAYWDDRIFELHSQRPPSEIIRREVGGQYEEYPADLLVERYACVEAIQHFLHTGRHLDAMVERVFATKQTH